MDEFTSAKSCLKKSRTDFFNILLVCHSKEPEATQNLGAKTKECDPYLAQSLGLDPSGCRAFGAAFNFCYPAKIVASLRMTLKILNGIANLP